MKYTPTEFDDTVNVTRVHPLINFGYLLGTVLVVSFLAFSGLGFLGAYLASNLGPETEAKIGAAMAEGVVDALEDDEPSEETSEPSEPSEPSKPSKPSKPSEQSPRETDPEAGADSREDYLEALLNSFYAAGHSPRLPLTVQVIRSDELNAFILPGGYIFVTDELLKQAESENELAFVLAHELGHFEARDNLKSLGRSLVFLTLSSVLNFGGNSASAVGQAISLGELRYSRKQESDADHFALDAVIQKYGHGQGSLDFFTKAAAESSGPEVELFSTHPLSEKRIEALETWAQDQNWSLDGPLSPLPEHIECPNFEPCSESSD